MRSLPRPSPLRALALALLIFAAHNAYTQPWTLDDAFITFRYAEHFAAGDKKGTGT